MLRANSGSGAHVIRVLIAMMLVLVSTSACWAGDPLEDLQGSRPLVAALFDREPMPFEVYTVARFQEDILALGQGLRGLPNAVGAVFEEVGWLGFFSLLFLLAAFPLGLIVERRGDTWRTASIAKLRSRLSLPAFTLLDIAGEVSIRLVVPFVLWMLFKQITLLTGYEAPWFLLVGRWLFIWFLYRLGMSLPKAILLEGKVSLPRENAQALFFGLRRAVKVGAVLGAFTLAILVLYARPDTVAVARLFFHVAVSVLLFSALVDRRNVFALLPSSETLIYQRFLHLFGQVYYFVLFGTLIVSLLWAVGFHSLAHIVFTRGWALVGTFVAALVARRFVIAELHERLLEPPPAVDTAERLYRALAKVVTLGIWAVTIVLFLHLLGLIESLSEFLGAQLVILHASQPGMNDIKFSPLQVGTSLFMVWMTLLLTELAAAVLNHLVYPHTPLDIGAQHALNKLMRYSLVAIMSVVALWYLGVQSQHLGLVAAGLGVGVGFGLQNLVSNLASGLILLIGRAAKKGDVISVNEVMGTVQEINMRSTVIRTLDNEEMLIPNSQLLSSTLINWTHSDPTVRLHVPVGVSYGSDPVRVREALLDAARSSPHVQKTPAPEAWFVGFGDSALDFELLVWVNVRHIAPPKLKNNLNFAIWDELQERDIEIPFPQRDLHLRTGVPWQELIDALRKGDAIAGSEADQSAAGEGSRTVESEDASSDRERSD